jgi:small subunit ribosomal protein S5
VADEQNQENKDTVPAEETEEVAPAEETEEVAPAEETEEVAPTEETEEVAPTEETEEVAPAEETEEVAPTEETEEVAPTEKTEEVAPTEKTPTEKTPTEKTPTEKTPTEKTPTSVTDTKGGRAGGNRRGGGKRRGPREPAESDGLTEKVIFINRTSKVVKGGRRFGFSALVVVGDKEGKVGLGVGKAREVITAIHKGNEDARRQMVPVSLKDATLPHEVFSIYDGARVLLRPASPGTGIIAGKTVRAVLESAGVRDVLSKSLGSNNPTNVAKAALQALRRLRRHEDVMAVRDKN